MHVRCSIFEQTSLFTQHCIAATVPLIPIRLFANDSLSLFYDHFHSKIIKLRHLFYISNSKMEFFIINFVFFHRMPLQQNYNVRLIYFSMIPLPFLFFFHFISFQMKQLQFLFIRTDFYSFFVLFVWDANDDSIFVYASLLKLYVNCWRIFDFISVRFTYWTFSRSVVMALLRSILKLVLFQS